MSQRKIELRLKTKAKTNDVCLSPPPTSSDLLQCNFPAEGHSFILDSVISTQPNLDLTLCVPVGWWMDNYFQSHWAGKLHSGCTQMHRDIWSPEPQTEKSGNFLTKGHYLWPLLLYKMISCCIIFKEYQEALWFKQSWKWFLLSFIHSDFYKSAKSL